MKVLITGSRTITNVAKVFDILRDELDKDDIVIHGGANGADSIAQAYCDTKYVPCMIITSIYPSKKEYYLHRDAEMVGMCDRVVAIWDGKSRGTKFTINYAKKRGKNVSIHKVLP